MITQLDPFRVYEPGECGPDGYPLAWHDLGEGRGVKHLVREQAEHRCVRCLHPYECGVSGGEWSPCDERCTHRGPYRYEWLDDGWHEIGPEGFVNTAGATKRLCGLRAVEARWRILTVHHLNGRKRDLRWWNLVALCQRDHLSIQGSVVLERVYPWPHDEWFKPYAAGWYAHTYLGEDLTREQVTARLDELLALELAA